MLINKKHLQDALEIVKPGLANKELIEQSTSFAFMKGTVVTYNDEISVSHPVPGLTLEGAIEAELLYKFISKIKSDEIDLSVNGKEVLLTSGRTKAGFTLQSEIKLPLQEDIAHKGKWHPLPQNFVKNLSFAMIAFTRSLSKGVLICAHVNKQGYIESSDGYRVIHCEVGEEMPVDTFLIPVISAEKMMQINPTEICEGNGWRHFRNAEGTVMSCRLFSDDVFPNTSAIFQMEGVRLALPESLSEVLEKAMVLSKRDRLIEESVSIKINGKRLIVEARADTGWFTEEINCKSEHSIEFSIMPYLLKEILLETRTCEISREKIKFQGDTWVYVSRLRNI